MAKSTWRVHEPRNDLTPRTRRNTFRKFRTPLGIFLILAFIIGAGVYFFKHTFGGATHYFPPWIELHSAAYPMDIQEKMIFTAVEFDNKFPCGRSVVMEDNKKIAMAAQARPGLIWLNPDKLSLANVRDSLLRELFTACKPDMVLLQSPIKTNEGKEIIAFEGLVIVDGERMPDGKFGKITRFELFEKAVAEALAAKVFPDFVGAKEMTTIRQKVQEHLSSSLEEIESWFKRTDQSALDEFLPDYMDKPINEFTEDDVNTATGEFSDWFVADLQKQ